MLIARRRVLALPDRMDWALGFICDDLSEALDSTHDIRVEQCPKSLDESLGAKFDTIYVAYASQYVRVPKALRRKTVTGVHSFAEYEGDRVRTLAHRLRRYSAVGCLAPAMKKDLVPMHGRIFWTPYGIPHEYVPADMVGHPKLRVGWVGNPNWGGRPDVKNFAALEAAVAELGDRVDLRVASNLPRREMPDFYRDLDVLVVTSRSEGAPLPLLESLCCGVPVVTTHVGLSDIHLQHGHNGWFHDGSAAALAARLRWLSENRSAVSDAKAAAASGAHLLRWPVFASYWRAFFDSVP